MAKHLTQHQVADALAAADVPFAFVTGYGGKDMRECDRDRPLLKKPFEFKRLAAKSPWVGSAACAAARSEYPNTVLDVTARF